MIASLVGKILLTLRRRVRQWETGVVCLPVLTLSLPAFDLAVILTPLALLTDLTSMTLSADASTVDLTSADWPPCGTANEEEWRTTSPYSPLKIIFSSVGETLVKHRATVTVGLCILVILSVEINPFLIRHPCSPLRATFNDAEEFWISLAASSLV